MQRAHAALYYAGLEEKRYQPIDGYSTGMKQRVKLAQALVHDPELLFLDEPTNGLDPQGTREVRNLIVDLARGGVTVFLSSHLLSEVDQICDHVGVMSVGRLVWQGQLASLRAEQAPRIRVTSARPAEAGRLLTARGLAGVAVDGTDVLALLGEARPEELLAALVQADLGVRGFVVERPSLEEQFVRLTGEGFDVSG